MVVGGEELVHFYYDALGRRDHLTRGNGGSAQYGYDGAGRLNRLTQAGAATQPISTQTLTYNPASQVESVTQADVNYVWQGRPKPVDLAYDGLNRDNTITVLSGGYDANANLGNDGHRSFTYDQENRLIHVTPSPGATWPELTLRYDPLGRLFQTVTGAGVSTTFLYDGDRLVGEYNGSSPLRHYVHGVGVDEPLVWCEGSSCGGTAKRWLHSDRQGSIIATSDSSGAITPYTYSAYGEPSDWGALRFRYTGQIALQEAQLYHYKARVYEPTMGRFLQTDPVGYKDDLNLYGYVHDDPINHSDPSGLATCGDSLTSGQCDAAMKAQDQAVKDIKAARSGIQELKQERAEIKSGTRSGLSDAASKTEQDTKEHFGSASNSTLNRVDRALGGAQSALEDRSGKWTFQSGGSSNNVLGSQYPFSHSINVTDLFFRSNFGEQVSTVAHEATHPFLARVPEGYSDVSMYGGALFFPWWAQNNAENYSHYVTGQH